MKRLRGIAKTDKDPEEIFIGKLSELTSNFSEGEIMTTASDTDVLDISKDLIKKNRKAYEDLSE